MLILMTWPMTLIWIHPRVRQLIPSYLNVFMTLGYERDRRKLLSHNHTVKNSLQNVMLKKPGNMNTEKEFECATRYFLTDSLVSLLCLLSTLH